MNTSPRLARGVAMAAPLLLLTSCSYLYQVTFSVTLGPVLAGAHGAVEFHVLEGTIPSRNGVAHEPGQVLHQGTVELCCAPDPRVTILAFFDSNINHMLDPGELTAWDPRGEFVLKENTNTTLHMVVPKTVAPKTVAPKTVAPKTVAPTVSTEQSPPSTTHPVTEDEPSQIPPSPVRTPPRRG